MRIDSLTSLRFFAAMGVFVHHFEFLRLSPSPQIIEAFNIAFEGFNGVTFFFILSGFIISHSFSERLRSGSYSFSDFMFFRVARLYPTHILTLIFAAVLYSGWNSIFTVESPVFLSNLLLLQSSIPDASYNFSFNGVSWSISVEMFFYLGFCLVALVPTRQLITLWLVLAVVIGINIAAVDLSGPISSWLFYINPAARFIDFLSGILLYRLYLFRPLNVAGSVATALEVGSLALLLAMTLFAVYGGVSIALRWDVYYIPPMALVVFVFAHQKGVVSRLLNWKPLILLGDASFALYMTHQLVINVCLRFFDPQTLVSRAAASGIALTIIAIGVVISVATYVLFERPLNLRLRRWWGERRGAS